MTPITRTEISHGTDNAWTDVDVTVHVDAGNTAGIILEIVNPTGVEHTWGVRKNGSIDVFTGVIEDVGHTWCAIGVDADDIFELYLSDASEVDVYITAYIRDDEGSFLTNAVAKTQINTFAWEDVDISGQTGGDTAICAFWLIDHTGAGLQRWGIKQNGSADDLWGRIFDGDLRGAMMSVDGAEICETYRQSHDIDFYLVGWLTDNFTSTGVDEIDYGAAGAAAYEDADLSGDIPAGNNGAMFHLHVQNAEYLGAVKKKGDAFDSYFDISEHQHGWVEIDANREVEQKVENTDLVLFLWGYTNEPPTGADPFLTTYGSYSVPVG